MISATNKNAAYSIHLTHLTISKTASNNDRTMNGWMDGWIDAWMDG